MASTMPEASSEATDLVPAPAKLVTGSNDLSVYSVVVFQRATHHGAAWKELNEAWILKFFALEPQDVEVLTHPEVKVLDAGGHIFLVVENEKPEAVLGCVGLKAMTDGGYEVIKMAVSESMQGRGLGRLLLQACVDKGRAVGAKRLYIETNSALGPALGLYRSMGFVDLPPQSTPYSRADSFLELRF